MKNIKRVLLTLCMITCFFALTACSKAKEEVKPLKEDISAAVCQISEGLLNELTSIEKEEIADKVKEAEEADSTAYAAAITSWGTVMDDTGKLVEIKDSKAEKEDHGYVCRINAQYEKRMAEFTVYLTKEGQLESTGFVAEYTTGETLTKAGLNTLMGMGTVFLVLIFISILIWCFKFVNIFANKASGKAATPAPAPAAPAAAVEEEELADDLELVAVITAAIAASTGASADGLVVRSIKRAGTSKWKRA